MITAKENIESTVSRETFAEFEAYVAEVQRWTKSINLIARSTEADIWGRHVQDSLTLFDHLRGEDLKIADLGSGGGFPGLVLALASKRTAPDRRFVLIESDKRKSAFLKMMTDKFGLNAEVHPDRIENHPRCAADVVTARALTSMTDLLSMAERHLTPGGRGLFLKGQMARQELEEAQRKWDFESRVFEDGALSCVVQVKSIKEKRKE
ncbi:MAG: 16S rRNA (guanine(527)-N(7))-methyltransferase RsmG [Paracoccaceae bacterium]